MAVAAHHGPRPHGETKIDHPVAVARLLQENEFPDVVVAAALLHDVVEDTETTLDELRRLFGEPVAGMVGALSDDESAAMRTQFRPSSLAR